MYEFDKVYGPNDSQEEVFKTLQMEYLVRQTMRGFNSNVIVTGATGSGKTFTTEGFEYTMAEERANDLEADRDVEPLVVPDEANLGFIPRLIWEMWRNKDAMRGEVANRYRFYVSMF